MGMRNRYPVGTAANAPFLSSTDFPSQASFEHRIRQLIGQAETNGKPLVLTGISGKGKSRMLAECLKRYPRPVVGFREHPSSDGWTDQIE